jgi:DNA-binding response OmpR family regulator
MVERKDKRVLVVDDDHECRLLLSTFVAQAGYRVEAVPDGPMALALMQAHSADVVLLDANLPGLNGFEVCKRIRENAKTANTGIVIVTAFIGDDARERGLAAGADEFVSKPFRADQVLDIIASLVKIAEARRQLDVGADALKTGLS